MAQQAAAPAIVSAWSSKLTVPRVIAEGDRLRHTKFVALDMTVSPGLAIRVSPPKYLGGKTRNV